MAPDAGFTTTEQDTISQTRLADVILRNSGKQLSEIQFVLSSIAGVKELPCNVFIVPSETSTYCQKAGSIVNTSPGDGGSLSRGKATFLDNIELTWEVY